MLIYVSLFSLCSACDLSLGDSGPLTNEDASKMGTLGDSWPLTNEEIYSFASKMESLGDKVINCLVKEAISNASRIGDPEKLDPSSVELLPVDYWDALNKSEKRIILTQVVFNQAIPLCKHVHP